MKFRTQNQENEIDVFMEYSGASDTSEDADIYTEMSCGSYRSRRIAKGELQERICKSINDFTTVFAGMQAVSEQHPVEMPDLVGSDLSLTAMIGFDGMFQGLAWVCCSTPLALRLTAGLCGYKPDTADNNVHSSLEELLNVLGGDVKLYLSSHGDDVLLSLPSLFYGKIKLHAGLTTDADAVCCSFLLDNERFLVGVTLRKAVKA